MSERKQGFEFLLGAKNPLAIGLIDHKNIADLHYSGLDRLDIVTHAGDENYYRYVSRFYYLDLVLADSDGLHDDLGITRRIQDRHGVDRRTRKPAEIPARRH